MIKRLFPRGSFLLVVMVSLCLSANVIVFTVVYSVLARPLPYEDSGQLVQVWEVRPQKTFRLVSPSWGEVSLWRNSSRTLEAVEATWFTQWLLSGTKEPMNIRGVLTTPGLFSLLGVKPHLGRVFTPADVEASGGDVAIVSYGLWASALGKSADIIGRKLVLQDPTGQGERVCTIVAVMPPAFGFPDERVEVWAPRRVADPPTPTSRSQSVYARLRSGVDFGESAAELANLSNAKRNATRGKGEAVFFLRSLLEQSVRGVKSRLLLLWGGVGLVLLIACGNAVHMQLIHVLGRTKEFAVRAALGAGRLELFGRVMLQNIVLFVLGGTIGLLLAHWGLRAVMAILPHPVFLPRAREIQIDLVVVIFSLALSAVAGVITGILPGIRALQVTHSLSTALSSGSPGGFTRRGGGRWLVVSEISLCVVLLVVAGLLVNSYFRLQQQDLGFQKENLLVASLALPGKQFVAPRAKAVFASQLRESLQQLPGVQVVGLSSVAPMIEFTGIDMVKQDGATTSESENAMQVGVVLVDQNYFQVLRVPLLQGRLFTRGEVRTTAPLAIVNQTLARQLRQEDPVGKRLTTVFGRFPGQYQIIGVVGDVKYNFIAWEVEPVLYLPLFADGAQRSLGVIARIKPQAGRLDSAMKQVIRSINPEIPIRDIGTAEEFMRYWFRETRFYGSLFLTLSLLSLFLVVLGLGGVLTHLVAQRKHEIGVRMALGAQPSDVVRMILKQGFVLILIGLAGGLLGSLAIARYLESLLYQVAPTDPITYLAVVGVLLLTSVLAMLLPARRATQVDPMVALRYE